jgi:hypothetical protein
VIDGDTIKVDRALDGKATVRLIGVNTPETVAPGQPIECFGPEASAYTKHLLEGQAVLLERDVSETDRFFGRTAAGDRKRRRPLVGLHRTRADGDTGAYLLAPTATSVRVVPTPTVGQAVSPPTQPSGGSNCHPSYQGCSDQARGGCIQLGIGDYDFAGGEGDGLNYAVGPITVVGSDEFRLDNNDPDVVACEPE